MKFSIYFPTFVAAITLGLTTSAQDNFTITNLHPSGTTASHSSQAQATGTLGQQVGYVKPSVGRNRAAVWSGTASSYVDLHPAGAIDSVAWGGGDGQQVGSVLLSSGNRASLWTGSASSWVNLHPAGWASSTAVAARGGQQVGRGTFTATTFTSAILWNGTAESFVILDPPNAGGNSRAEGTDGVQQVGSWVAPASGSPRAALWSGSAASHVDLHPAGTQLSQAFDVSNGQQVGYVRLFPQQPGGDTVDVASLWSGTVGSWVNLNPAGAWNSRAQGVFEGRQVGFARGPFGETASLWSGTADSWVNLGAFLPSQFSRSQAMDICRVGDFLVITGFGFNTATNRTEALTWTAVLTQPSTVVTRATMYFGATGSSASTLLATDKVALLPGQISTFANYTNYSRGLNGIVVDVNGLPSGTTNAQMLSSLQFATWDGIAASGFVALPGTVVPTVAIAAGGGAGNSARVTITFPDNAVQNTWLRVTVLSNANTGLAANDVFYFGNVIGEFNTGNTAARLRVNATDTGAVRGNQSTAANSASVTNIFDVNRDGRVNATDLGIVRANQQTAGIVAPIIAPSAAPTAGRAAGSPPGGAGTSKD